MPIGIVRLRGLRIFVVLGGICFLATAVPLACSRGGGASPADAVATGGANGETRGDAAEAGGAGGRVTDAGGPDVSADSSVGDSSAAAGGGSERGGQGGVGGTRAGEGGVAGGRMADAGPPDVTIDGTRIDQGGAGGGNASDAASGRDGPVTDGGSADAMFSCGPCGINWACGGASGTPYTYVTLVSESDGCYLSGLPGHKLLAPDGTITEDGVNVGRAQRFGPQVGLYHPDGSDWLYCGGALPCPTSLP